MPKPRKVIYSVGASLDGYIASPDGSYGWLEKATKRAKGADFGRGKFFASIQEKRTVSPGLSRVIRGNEGVPAWPPIPGARSCATHSRYSRAPCSIHTRPALAAIAR